MILAGFIYLFMLLNVFIIQIINAGSDDIDLELRLGLPTSMNDAKSQGESAPPNKAEQSQKIALEKPNKKIPKDPGNRERKRRRRMRIKESGSAAIEKEKAKERKYAANQRQKVQNDPKLHAAYKEKLKKYREEKKALYQIDPIAREAAKIQRRKRDQRYAEKRKLKSQQRKLQQQTIPSI